MKREKTEVNCRRREKDTERNVCCDNYFLFGRSRPQSVIWRKKQTKQKTSRKQSGPSPVGSEADRERTGKRRERLERNEREKRVNQ